MVLIPLLASFGESPARGREVYRALQIVLFFTLLLFMGFRDTCGDFERYVEMYEAFKSESLIKNLTVTESIYGFFNWLSAQFGWEIYGVNTLCALVFLGCLFYAANQEPMPFYFLSISMPYFVIVVGMGYTRQGVAASLILLSMQSLRFGKPWLFATQIVVAAGFHASAFAALPAILFGQLNYKNNASKLLVRTIVIGLGIFGFYSVLRARYDLYVIHYIEFEGYTSGGALLRTSVTGIAGVLFYWKRNEWQRMFGDRSSLQLFAFASLAVVPFSLIASTPADRIGLYLIPFQLIVFSRFPCLMQTKSSFRNMQLAIAVGYVLYFFTWLHLGTYSRLLWVPYETALW